MIVLYMIDQSTKYHMKLETLKDNNYVVNVPWKLLWRFHFDIYEQMITFHLKQMRTLFQEQI